MKILVTGVAGAIGSHMAEKLLEEGHEVLGIDILTDYYSPEIKKINLEDVKSKGVTVFIKDLAKDNIYPIVKDVEAVFHFAAQPGISEFTTFQDYLNNNIIATQNLLEVSKVNKKLKAFIFASTSSVYGKHANDDETSEPKPASWYGVTKLAAEQLVLATYRNDLLPVVSLRLFSVYGERERPEKLFHKLTKAIMEDRKFTLYDGSMEHRRSYTYVEDVISGCMLTLEKIDDIKGEILNIGNDKTNTTREGIEIIENILGKKAKFDILPKRAGDQIETVANISKAKELLGYNPKVSLEEGLKREVVWYQEKIHIK